MHAWWKGCSIYQIYPRSFADSNNDGVGDLPGITEKLDYVANLGVDGIWLSPFFTSPMRDFGYDVANYCDVEPVFGTLADFDALIERAHSLGLKVIIDQVYSHTSDRHPWFQASRMSGTNDKSDWYVWADPKIDGTVPNNWLSVFGGPAWSWDTSRKQYYMHNFLSEQPDLNFHNPDVQEALLDVARFWLDRGVDGFRLDVANYYAHDKQLRDNPPSGLTGQVRPYQFQRHLNNRSQPEALAFVEKLRALIDTYEDRMTVAEIYSTAPNPRSIDYTRGNKRLHTAYSFLFLEATEISASLVRRAMEDWQGVDAWPAWSFSNHDVKRVLSRWGGDGRGPGFARMLNALLLSLRGTIFLYQGEELGLPQGNVPYEKLQDPEAIRFWPDNLGRDGGRTPMPWQTMAHNAGFSVVDPWLPADPQQQTLAVDVQELDEHSTLAFTSHFLRLRAGSSALKHGDIRFIDAGDEKLVVFERLAEGERIACAFNLGRTSRSLPLAVLSVNKKPQVIDSGLGGSLVGDDIMIPGEDGVLLTDYG